MAGLKNSIPFRTTKRLLNGQGPVKLKTTGAHSETADHKNWFLYLLFKAGILLSKLDRVKYTSSYLFGRQPVTFSRGGGNKDLRIFGEAGPAAGWACHA